MRDDLDRPLPDRATEPINGVADVFERLDRRREVLDGVGEDGGLLLEAGAELVEIAAVYFDDRLGLGGDGFDETAEGPCAAPDAGVGVWVGRVGALVGRGRGGGLGAG